MSLISNAISYGLLKYDRNHQLTHIPFSLQPFEVTRHAVDTMKNSSRIYGDLLMGLPQAFLENYLEPLAPKDSFVEILLQIVRKSSAVSQPYRFAIGRNDFFLNTAGIPKQVEFNTVSVSFPSMSEKVTAFHRSLYASRQIPGSPQLNPISTEMNTNFTKLFQYYGHDHAILLMVVQENEQNIFDQLAFSRQLFESTGIMTLRATLGDIGRHAVLRNGHVFYHHHHIGVVYYRAGYAPNDYIADDAIQGRIILEQSDAIKIPDIQYQLAGMKIIQAVLTDDAVLATHLNDVTDRTQIHATSVYTRSMQERDTREKVRHNPDRFVVKPQREGGGNNYFGSDIPLLCDDPSTDLACYIAMERIIPAQHQASLVVQNEIHPPASCVSEVGWYTVTHAQAHAMNTNIAGYLVRTKLATENEGGVCAGYAALNTLSLK